MSPYNDWDIFYEKEIYRIVFTWDTTLTFDGAYEGCEYTHLKFQIEYLTP